MSTPTPTPTPAPAPATDWRTTATPAIDTRATKPKPWWQKTLSSRATSILLLDIVLFIFFSIVTHGLFASLGSIQALLLTGTEALLLALGLTMLLGAGIFDLSLGANLVLSSVVGATIMKAVVAPDAAGNVTGNLGLGIFAGLVAAVLTGAIFGLVNGILVAYGRINALIATLGTLGVGTGLALVISGGADLGGLPAQLQSGFGLAAVGPIPLPTIVAIVAAVILFLVVRFTRFGMRTLAIGSSRPSAERVGIRVPAHLLKLTIMAGALAGIAGFINIAHFAGTSINGHANDALNAVTAAVIGGTLLEGGRISILGTVWGAALAVILQGGLVMIGVSSYYQLMAVGIVLIIAVGLDRISYVRRRATT
ncbi:ABC transporter permease [Leifsonia shinshuensis]|uniref:Ribose transport system permease protein n=1 Tax=Leifsonia shinshuensis TaxID=150026 RepID=A0A853CYI7_9MICO|nr:ABC transporter permease [Leifsonia shinshuensis]NYJ25608.1 ribose transport system permease protein [Leifsonia shinshuensis]